MNSLDKAILDLLKEAGLPEATISLKIEMFATEPTIIECKFYPKSNSSYVIEMDEYKTEIKKYKIVEIEDGL